MLLFARDNALSHVSVNRRIVNPSSNTSVVAVVSLIVVALALRERLRLMREMLCSWSRLDKTDDSHPATCALVWDTVFKISSAATLSGLSVSSSLAIGETAVENLKYFLLSSRCDYVFALNQ